MTRRVAVLGPTASGKSSVALAAAGALPSIELVSVDSMQVYRGMDIGTAKPSIDEQRQVPHHLIDLVDPSDEFTVAEFQRAYRDAIAAIGSRGHVALLVGGTGLYHRAAIDELDLPGEWPAIRARLLDEIADSGLRPLYDRLVAIDEVAASKIEPTNERRIVRALEVCEGSGRPFSSFGPGLDAYPDTAVTQIGLRWPRDVLTARIEARVHAMLDRGFLDEARAFAQRDAAGQLSRTAAQALGYKELMAYLRDEMSYDEAVDRVVVRTRQFAVRQLRWFQRDPRIRWIDIEHDPVAEATPAVVAAFDTSESA